MMIIRILVFSLIVFAILRVAFMPFLLLPFGKLNHLKLRRRLLAWVCLSILLILLGLVVANVAYFGEVQRHIGSEILNLGQDMGFIAHVAFTSRWQYTVFWGLFLCLLIWVYIKTVIQSTNCVSGSLTVHDKNFSGCLQPVPSPVGDGGGNR